GTGIHLLERDRTTGGPVSSSRLFEHAGREIGGGERRHPATIPIDVLKRRAGTGPQLEHVSTQLARQGTTQMIADQRTLTGTLPAIPVGCEAVVDLADAACIVGALAHAVLRVTRSSCVQVSWLASLAFTSRSTTIHTSRSKTRDNVRQD